MRIGFSKDCNSVLVKYSPQGVIVECDKSMRGFTQEEIIGLSQYNHIHPDDIERTTNIHISIMNDPRTIVPVYMLLRKIHKDGGYMNVEFVGMYKTDINGDRWFYGIERVIAQQRFTKMLQSVIDIIPSGVIIVNSREERVDACNLIANDWFKISLTDKFEISFNNNELFDEKNAQKLQKFIQLSYQKKTHNSIISSMDQKTNSENTDDGYLNDYNTDENEITVKTKDDCHFTFKVCKFFNENDNINNKNNELMDTITDASILWVINDITKLKNAMEKKQGDIIHFMRCTSHDMRTPMQAITLAASSIKDYHDNIHKDVDTITSALMILETIVSNILEFKTINSSQIIIKNDTINIYETIQKIIYMFKNSTLLKEQVNILFEFNWKDKTSYNINIDGTMLNRIVLNLISNSLKFTQNGTVKLICELLSTKDNVSINRKKINIRQKIASINTHNAHDAMHSNLLSTNGIQNYILHLTVVDTGCGMSEQKIKHMGELNFFDGEKGGFGLGTFIVSSYIKLLKGSMDIESLADVGTIISVKIPITIDSNKRIKSDEEYAQLKTMIRTRSKSSSHETQKSDDEIILNEPSVPPPKIHSITTFEQQPHINIDVSINKTILPQDMGDILVVEDVLINRKLVTKALKKVGFKVDEAVNGKIALDMMLTKQYRTVFMDINMPIMNGDEAVKKYWEQTTSICHPKIYMLTGNITDADRTSALKYGAHDFLTKPINAKKLWENASWMDEIHANKIIQTVDENDED